MVQSGCWPRLGSLEGLTEDDQLRRTLAQPAWWVSAGYWWEVSVFPHLLFSLGLFWVTSAQVRAFPHSKFQRDPVWKWCALYSPRCADSAPCWLHGSVLYTRWWGLPLLRMTEGAGSYSLFSTPPWFLSLTHVKYIHPFCVGSRGRWGPFRVLVPLHLEVCDLRDRSSVPPTSDTERWAI